MLGRHQGLSFYSLSLLLQRSTLCYVLWRMLRFKAEHYATLSTAEGKHSTLSTSLRLQTTQIGSTQTTLFRQVFNSHHSLQTGTQLRSLSSGRYSNQTTLFRQVLNADHTL
jgi:hypothetical protein